MSNKIFGDRVKKLRADKDMAGKEPEGNATLHFLQRNLKGMNEEQLEKAKNVLISVFDDIFEDDEE